MVTLVTVTKGGRSSDVKVIGSVPSISLSKLENSQKRKEWRSEGSPDDLKIDALAVRNRLMQAGLGR